MGKKILFVYYQNIKQGGISKSLANLTKELADEKRDVTILFLMEPHADFYPIDPRVRKIYINSFDTPQFRFGSRVRKWKFLKSRHDNIINYLYDAGCCQTFWKWLVAHHEEYEIIISCWYKLSSYISLKPKIAKKTFAWEHTNYKTGGYLYYNLLRKNYSRLKGIICLTNDAAKYYRALNKSTTVIPNIIGDSFENNDCNIEEKENIILMAGRLDPEKNVTGFLNIIKSAKIPPDWEIVIAGSGWLAQNLQLQKDELLLPNVQFLGALSLDKMIQLYTKSKIFCMTSLVEGLPTVLIEAMFFGNTLIAYDCPTGPAEIINEKNGFLIPLNDEKLFKEKLEILVNDEEKLQNLMKSSKSESKNWKKSEILDKWKQVLV